MKEYRIMSPPRRSKGEKPRISIRFLQRQIANIQNELAICRQAMGDRDKAIARYDVELSEAADRERIFDEQVMESAEQYGALLAAYQKNATRLAFLEGYYEKSKELAVSEALLAHDPAETNRGSSSGNTGNLPGGTQAPKEEGLETAKGRTGRRPRETVLRIRPDDTAYPDRRSMAEFEVGLMQDRTAPRGSRGNPIVENDI